MVNMMNNKNNSQAETEKDRASLTPIRRPVVRTCGKDYGADPLGKGMFRMVPSGDVVDLAERNRRLRKSGK